MKAMIKVLCIVLLLAVLGALPVSVNGVATASGAGAGNAIERALAQARARAGVAPGKNHGGSGATAQNPGDVYLGQVMRAVRPYWDFPSARPIDLSCVVEVKVDMRGNVLQAVVGRGSGDIQFDTSAVNAVFRTGQTGEFPPPPGEEYCDMDLVFTSDGYAAHGGPDLRKEDGLPRENVEGQRFMAEWAEKEQQDRARWEEADRRMKAEMEEEDRRIAAALAEQQRRWDADWEETERRRAAQEAEEQRRMAAQKEKEKRRAEEEKRARAELDRTLQESGQLHPVGPKIFGMQLGMLYTSARQNAEKICMKREKIVQGVNPCMDQAGLILLLLGTKAEAYGSISNDIFIAGAGGILLSYSLPLSIFNYEESMNKDIFIKKFEEAYHLDLECKKESEECKYVDNSSGYEVSINFKTDILNVKSVVKESDLIFK